jgi:hypothetical protein
MVEQSDIHPPSDGQSDVDRLLGLVDAPVAALASLAVLPPPWSRALRSGPSASWRTTSLSDGPRPS